MSVGSIRVPLKEEAAQNATTSQKENDRGTSLRGRSGGAGHGFAHGRRLRGSEPGHTASDGPQSANVPYVAWVGEHVRLVACDPAIDSAKSGQFANYQVEDWSGYQFQPPTPDGDSGNNLGQIFDPGPAAFFTSSEPRARIPATTEPATAASRPTTSRSTRV